MSLKEFIKKITNQLDEHFSKDDKEKIQVLEEDIIILEETLDNFNGTINELQDEAKTREEIILDLFNENNTLFLRNFVTQLPNHTEVLK